MIGHIILAHLQIGRYIYAVGGNSNAAEACGISPNKVKMFVHVFCGTCAGLAGVILSSRVITGHPAPARDTSSMRSLPRSSAVQALQAAPAASPAL